MQTRLSSNRYGKAAVRLVRVNRHGDRHDLKDVTLRILFEGDFEAAFALGDNALILPTDTMKNTVYVAARQRPFEDIEEFGLTLADHFLAHNPAVSRVAIDLAEHLWTRLAVGEKPHRHAFRRSGTEERTATVLRTRDGVTIEAGLCNLMVLKSAGSGFEGFRTDEYTTLGETSDRLLATLLTASWTYRTAALPFGICWRATRQVLLETFAEHESRSVQHTLHAMGEAALATREEIEEIRFSLPNRHHLLVDLSRFGLENPNEVFVATEEPYGLIEATVTRTR
jgi:urate oxidase